MRDLGLTTYWMSRPLIEFTARQRVRLHPKIAIRERCRALEGFPRGFLPFGDAICRFNPVYGQGMSVAAQEAHLLYELLRRRAAEAEPLAGLASAFFAEAATMTETPGHWPPYPISLIPRHRENARRIWSSGSSSERG